MINPTLVNQTPVTQIIFQSGYTPIINQPIAHPNHREWTNPICGCFNNCGDCVFAFICPPCFQVKLFWDANEDCCSCAFGGLVPLRTRIRAERGIDVKFELLRLSGPKFNGPFSLNF